MLLAKHYLYAFAFMFLCAFSSAQSQAQAVDRKQAPAEFINQVSTQTLEVVKADKAAQAGDRQAINQLVNQYVLPYVNFEKTTRLAAGRHWRQASESQRQKLVDAFKNTLIRTYSGALADVNQLDSIQVNPFRGNPEADDVVVRTTIIQKSGPEVGVDYRMENTPDGWLIYDLNVEGIWLIQNYRNQFGEIIGRDGIDGLIDTLNKQSLPAQNS